MTKQDYDPLTAAVIDLRNYLRNIIAAKSWHLPSGELVTYSLPLTAAEVAEDCGIDDPRNPDLMPTL